MTVMIVNNALNALTPDGLYQLWRSAFGLSASLPDTAALVLEPTDLLTRTPLSGMQFSDFTLDENSITSIEGSWTVTQSESTGLAVATMTVALTSTTTSVPSGAILYNLDTETLVYVTAFQTYPPNIDVVVDWTVSLTADTCQG